MAELLIMAKDKINRDPIKNAEQWKRGDVVEARSDRWPWSRREKQSALFRILRVPKLTVTEQEGLVAPPVMESIDGEALPGTPKRARRLNVTLLPVGEKLTTIRNKSIEDVSLSSLRQIVEIK